MRDKEKGAKMLIILNFSGWVGISQNLMYFMDFEKERESRILLIPHCCYSNLATNYIVNNVSNRT